MTKQTDEEALSQRHLVVQPGGQSEHQAIQRASSCSKPIYLSDLLRDKFGMTVEGVLPEFPVRVGTVDLNSDTNQSFKIDYLVKIKNSNGVIFLELKTDDGSRRSKPGPGPDHSSEAERRKPQVWQKGGKLAKITINREAVLTVDQAQLPADAEFKGYEDSIVQDVVLRTDNVLFHKEKYYSPSACRTYLAELPPGYTGQFGPGIKALALVQYFACNVAEPKILEFFTNVGIHLSAGELSNWLIKDWWTCTPRRSDLQARAGEGLRKI